MRSFISPLIILLLLFYVPAKAQSFTKISTAVLLQKAATDGTTFLNSSPQKQLYYALPLIDSTAAVKLALQSAEGKIDFVSIDNYPDYVFAIGLQCRNYALKNILLHEIDKYDSKCTENILRSQMTIADYRVSQMNYSYEYDQTLRAAIYRQVDKNDTALFNKAIDEYKYWGLLNRGYNDTILNPSGQPFSIKKKEFDPCLLASEINAGFWRTCIYWMTGNDTYNFDNDKLNENYKRTGRQPGNIKNPADLKDFVRPGKRKSITLNASYNDLASIDFDSEPELKAKLDECRTKKLWEIIIYTNGSKGLLYMNYIDQVKVQFNEQPVAITNVYLLELKADKTINISTINYRDRYY